MHPDDIAPSSTKFRQARGSGWENMPRREYARLQLELDRNSTRLEYARAVKRATRARLRRTLWWAAVLLTLAVGVWGIMTGAQVQGIG